MVIQIFLINCFSKTLKIIYLQLKSLLKENKLNKYREGWVKFCSSYSPRCIRNSYFAKFKMKLFSLKSSICGEKFLYFFFYKFCLNKWRITFIRWFERLTRKTRLLINKYDTYMFIKIINKGNFWVKIKFTLQRFT